MVFSAVVFAVVMLAVLITKGFGAFFVSNYRGKAVFLAGFFLTSFSALTVSLLNRHPDVSTVASAALLISVSGLVDDVFGSPEKGFRGHLRALTEGRITSGLFKLVSISLISMFVAFKLEDDLLARLSSAVILASSSNLFNLLDLRPGRSVKSALPVFFAGTIILRGELKEFALVLLSIYLIYLFFDLREFTMLGDAGANPLGFFAATIVIFAVKITMYKLVIALFLVGLNLVSEKVSFTKIIEGNKILNFVDRLGRMHGKEEGSNGKES